MISSDNTEMLARLERYFEFESLGTNWRTEIVAGLTTFMTMSYIIFVNPSILRETGMPFEAVVAATCFSAAFGSILFAHDIVRHLKTPQPVYGVQAPPLRDIGLDVTI